MTRSRSRQLRRPRDLPGFEEAVAAGVTPSRPTTPPPVGSNHTSHQAFIRLAVTLGVAVAASILALVVLPTPNDSIRGKTFVIFIVVLAIGYFAVRSSLRAFRSILLDELQAGYTTTTFVQGLFWMRRHEKTRIWGDDVVGWDWDGLWVLDSQGIVVSVPDLSADPPGIYPSPNKPGQRELWTGYMWTSVYFDT